MVAFRLNDILEETLHTSETALPQMRERCMIQKLCAKVHVYAASKYVTDIDIYMHA